MQLADVPKRAVVQAARDGDPVALDELVSGYLPLVYNVVGRAADADLDVDDTVQDTMLQVVAGLPGLRDIGSARSWVLAIAVHQLTDARRRAQARRTQQIPVAPDLFDPVDPASDFVSLFLLRGSLSREQREVTQAARWLDPGYRDLLSGWWLEVAGELGRGDLAAAFGQSNGTLAVQVKRMRTQLDTCRSVVRALSSSSCPDLAWSVAGWDGVPAPLWRKRIARHVRDCPTCSSFSARLVPPERLLASLGVVPVPVALAAAVRMAAAAVGRRVVEPGSHATGASAEGPGAGARSARSARSARFAWSARTGLHLGAGTGLKLAAAAAVVVLAAAGAAGYSLAGTRAPAAKTAAKTAATAAGSSTAPAVSSQAHLAHLAQRGHRQPPTAMHRHTASPAATTALAAGPVFSSVVPPVPSVGSVTGLGAITQNARVAGRDNGQSAEYDGKSVWIFDDTTLKNLWGFLSNSAAATTDLDAAAGSP